MFFVQDYSVAVLFCVITMFCWGSWGNTQKLAGKSWRYELFYWDYVIGVLLFAILSGLTLGSFGAEGRSFLPDLRQASLANLGSAFLGGIVFNAANLLLSAAISIAGMSVAFPVGIGLALVLGGVIWGLGNALNLVAAGKAGAAISYGLGQGATLVAALWGILVWKEFRGAPRSASLLNFGRFVLFLSGLALIIRAGT